MNEPILAESDKSEYSTWYNPTKSVIVVDVYVGHPGLTGAIKGKDGVKIQSPWKRYEWKPETSRQLPAEYDAAIHTVSKDGKTIVGGGAPQLVKKGCEHRVIAQAIDEVYQGKKRALEEAASLLNKRVVVDAALASYNTQVDEAKKK